MTRRYSPNHPAVKSSPQVMTAQAWSKLYRWPLAAIGGGFVVSMAGWFMPAVALYGWPVSIIWCLPGVALCLAGFSRCQYIYEIEKSFDQ
jgi:fatty acid desaturase